MTNHSLSDKPEGFEVDQEIQLSLQLAAMRAAERGVKPFFVDRVMRSVAVAKAARLPAEEMFEGLVGWFRPIAVASLLIIIGLVGFNLKEASTHELAVSVSESVLGLPAVSVETAFELNDE
jgi:hypothetical protein